MTGKYQALFLKANVNSKVKVKRETFEGVEHVVVPVIAAQEGVMNELFYPAEEFRDWVETWNGVPVPISHPQVNGIHVSARSPQIQEKTSVGWFFNVEFTNDNKLKGEIWLNTEKAEALNAGYIIEQFESGEIMEVSTGLYSNLEMISGEYKGTAYKATVRHIRPDHLALLPNEVGACSVEDGCGAMRNNKDNCACKEPRSVNERVNKALKLVAEPLGLNINNSSFEERIKAVSEALFTENEDYLYILDIYQDYVIYEYKRELFKRSYVMTEGKAVLSSDTQKVIRKVTYSPAPSDNKQKENGGNKMEKQELVNQVIALSTNKFTEDDVDILTALGEDVLSKMAVNEEAEEPETKEESEVESKEADTDVEAVEEAEEPETKEEPEAVEKASEPELNTEQKVNSLLEGVEDTSVKEYLSNAVTKHEAEKASLVSEIVANSLLTEEDAKVLAFNQLQKLAKSLRKPNFNGRGTAFNSEQADAPMPSIFDIKGE